MSNWVFKDRAAAASDPHTEGAQGKKSGGRRGSRTERLEHRELLKAVGGISESEEEGAISR